MATETDFAELLRESAQRIEIDGVPSQIGMSPDELRGAADEIEKLYRIGNELLLYVNGLARNSTEVVKSMRDFLDR